MPDPLNNLRNDIAEAILAAPGGGTNADKSAASVLRWLAAASGEQRRALLGILGYEVTEVTTGHVYISERSGTYAFVDGPALVLRDQRETTDG